MSNVIRGLFESTVSYVGYFLEDGEYQNSWIPLISSVIFVGTTAAIVTTVSLAILGLGVAYLFPETNVLRVATELHRVGLLTEPNFEAVYVGVGANAWRISRNRIAALQATLNQAIKKWSQEFEAAYPAADYPKFWDGHQKPGTDLKEYFAQLLALEPDAKGMLSNYLQKLRTTKDYTDGGLAKNNVILRVERMLQLANSHSVFKDDLLSLLSSALETCGDRVLIFFNDIEILWQFQHRKLKLEEFRSLAIRAERYEQLKAYAQNIYLKDNLSDEIEVILFYHLKLKDDLTLPITTENMLFPRQAGVTVKMLEDARERILSISDEQLLATSNHWLAFMERSYPEQVDPVKEKYIDLQGKLETYYGLEEDARKSEFLENNQVLRTFFEEATVKKVNPVDYNAMSRFLLKERQVEISVLDILVRHEALY